MTHNYIILYRSENISNFRYNIYKNVEYGEQKRKKKTIFEKIEYNF